ncbi:MAG: arginine--tRNA ligase [Gammaproteobacteria bacterium]|nr:MAG: arginine--tRNA ligase [Gammaproteobacteria bacterium]
MKAVLTALLEQVVSNLKKEGVLADDVSPKIVIEHTRDPGHGDFASNLAMMLAKPARQKPRDLAEKIVAALPENNEIDKVEIAGPGFINFFMNSNTLTTIVPVILDAGEAFGHSTIGRGKRVQVEFVSANPTGPLHVGHGRGAAYGAAVADLLAAVGFQVHREYYVNDAGRQMDILCASVWIRYLSLCGTLPDPDYFPVNGYKGDYVWDIAAHIHRNNGDKFQQQWNEIAATLPADECDGGDKEIFIDAVIAKAKECLGAENYRFIFDSGLNYILDDIRDDLAHFGVVYEEWFSERSLTDEGLVTAAVERLQKSGHAEEREGAIWFKSTDFGDEKDRVLVRANGQSTYFASDIAYHMNKLERGYDQVIDIWGADHHGYVPRVKAAMEAVGDDPKKLHVLLVQFAILYRGKEKMQMSTRSGEFVTLRQLRKEVGSDAARFFYVMRKCEQHLDFDLELAKSKSNENPMYYIQYAHARVCSVLRQLDEKGFSYDQDNGLDNLDKLTEKHEQALMTTLSKFSELVETAALIHEPHQLANYLRELANDYHTYYNAHQFIVDDEAIRNSRLALIKATKQVLQNGLGLLGVSAPNQM